MDYQQTLNYLFSQLPMYQRVGKAAYKANLNNTLVLDKHFGYPHKKYKTIHVAGTNGKGSISHMLASILQEAGYRVGLYASPHLKDFRERIKINGIEVSEEYVVDFVKENKSILEKIQPSFFEMTVAMAFEHFANQKVEVAVVEVGMGGRLDSTNIITPELSIITNIGLDHTEFLGDTLEKIAFEKAGIIKTNVPTIVSQHQNEIESVFENKAKELNAPLLFADKIYKVKSLHSASQSVQEYEIKRDGNTIFSSLSIDLLGNYQAKNLSGALCAIDSLKMKGFKIDNHHIKEGLKKITKNTGILGRWQVLMQNPLTVCDCGHNVEGITQILAQIEQTKFNQLHFVLGMVGDKDIDAVLQILPKNAIYYFTKASIPRAINQDVLAAKAADYGLIGTSYPSVKQAVEWAKKNAVIDDMIFIGGSTFVVADAIT